MKIDSAIVFETVSSQNPETQNLDSQNPDSQNPEKFNFEWSQIAFCYKCDELLKLELEVSPPYAKTELESIWT